MDQNYHIPILVQAKSVSPQDEWKDMIIRVLGLSQGWSEEELWSALEALSYRNEINNSLSRSEIRIIPKVIICIDGVDEIKPYTRWNDRISQVNAITSRHQRIRFCFTGRPYAFDRKRMLSEQNLKRYLLDAFPLNQVQACLPPRLVSFASIFLSLASLISLLAIYFRLNMYDCGP